MTCQKPPSGWICTRELGVNTDPLPDPEAVEAVAESRQEEDPAESAAHTAAAFTVDRYGGTYAITRVLYKWAWWQRPRWAYRLWWWVRMTPGGRGSERCTAEPVTSRRQSDA